MTFSFVSIYYTPTQRSPFSSHISMTIWLIFSFFLLSTDVRECSEDMPDSGQLLRDCYRGLGRAYHEVRPRDNSPKAKEFRRRSWWLTAAVVRALDKLRLPHWLASGTLLGMYVHVRVCVAGCNGASRLPNVGVLKIHVHGYICAQLWDFPW